MISKDTIDKIFSVVRLEEIIGEFVQLKKAGANLKGLSPFVDEKTPSFIVSPSKQIWKDFSTSKGGNIITFLMEHEHFTYVEALTYLAKRYNIEVVEDKQQTPEQLQQSQKKENLYKILDVANNFFKDRLINTEEGKNIALQYFKQVRGFSEQTIKKFGLGYSPQNKSAFCDFAISKGFKKEFIQEVGIGIFNENNTKGFDRFNSRVIFPIFSLSGRILGFGGRTLSNDKKIAKYLNSPESEIYHKGSILYGVYQAKTSIIKNDNCLLVEGYTDVISLHQAGIENVVASSGTALTENQILIIKRLTQNITLIFDGDNAGIKASFRSIDLLLQKGMNVKVVLLPKNQDPDSFARNNSEQEIKEFINDNSKDFIQFKINVLKEDADKDPVKKVDLIRDIVKSISFIDNEIKKEVYIKECSNLLQIQENVLRKELALLQGIKEIQESKKEEKQELLLEKGGKDESLQINRFYLFEENIIKTLLSYGNYIITINYKLENKPYEITVIEEFANQFKHDDINFEIDFYKRIFQEIISELEKGKLRTAEFYSLHQEQEIVKIASNSLLENEQILSPNWEEKGIYVKEKSYYLAEHVKQLILRYKILFIEKKIKQLSNDLILIQEDTNENNIKREEICRRIINLTKNKNEINKIELSRDI